MAERSSLNQVVQIGVESEAGTAVAATRRLQSLSIEPSPSVEVDTFRPAGSKYSALASLMKESVEASIEGRATYSEIIYPLASVLTKPVTTQPDPTNAPTMYKHVFSPSSTADDNPATFTIEHGSAVRASVFPYGLVTEFGLTVSRDSIEISGSMFAKALRDNVVMTPEGDVTLLDLVPCLPTQATVYMDDTPEALGTTKMTRLTSAEVSLGSRFGQLWVVDAAQESFANHIETEPDLSASMTVQADGQGMSILNMLRSGGTKFLRIEFVGDQIGTGDHPENRYRVTWDMAIKVSDTGGFSDEDGMYAVEWSYVGVHSAEWGKALEVTVVNEVPGL